jgi:hypothetical protein
MFSEKIVSIEKFNIVTTNTACGFSVEINKVNLFVNAELRVMLFDENNNFIKCDSLTLSGDDYKKWTNDDEYIYAYVANYYGFSLTLPQTN